MVSHHISGYTILFMTANQAVSLIVYHEYGCPVNYFVMIPIYTHSSVRRSNFWIPINRFFLPSSLLAWARGPECWYHIVSSPAVILGQVTQPYLKYLLGFWKIGPEYFLPSPLTQSFLKYLLEEGSNMSQAVHHSIAKLPIAESSNASPPALYPRAVHHEPSIMTSTSRSSLHLQAVHRELSIATSPSRPALYCQAV